MLHMFDGLADCVRNKQPLITVRVKEVMEFVSEIRKEIRGKCRCNRKPFIDTFRSENFAKKGDGLVKLVPFVRLVPGNRKPGTDTGRRPDIELDIRFLLQPLKYTDT